MQLASLMDFVAGGLKPALFETMSFQLAFSAWSWSLCRVVRALGCIWPWDAYGNDTSAWILKSLVYNSYGAIHPTCPPPSPAICVSSAYPACSEIHGSIRVWYRCVQLVPRSMLVHACLPITSTCARADSIA